MAEGRGWCWPLVLVLVAAPTLQGVKAIQSNSSINCGKEPDTVVGLGHRCTCDIDCDADQNLYCEDGRCLCQPDSVFFNQTCLLKGHHNQPCRVSQQCQDPHQRCDPVTSLCGCQPGFTETTDQQSLITSICRPVEGGRLGANCSSVADCNWELEHAACPADLRLCRCQLLYYGQTGGLVCAERAWTVDTSWWIAVCLIAVAVIITGLALILSCVFRECYRSHQRSRGRVITVMGPPDADNQPPPPYVAVISGKEPAYAPPVAESSVGMDNYGFTSCELEPYTEKKH